MRGQGVRFSLWSTLLRGMQGEWKFELATRDTPSLTSFFDPFTNFRLRLPSSSYESHFRVSYIYIYIYRVREYFFTRGIFDTFFFVSFFLKRKKGRRDFKRLGFKRGTRKSIENVDREAMWPGSERSECECTMRPRLRRSYRPSIARPCTRGNRETIRAWSLTLPSSSWTKNLAKVSFFTISRIVFLK